MFVGLQGAALLWSAAAATRPVGSVLLRWIIVAVIASLVAPVYNQTVEQELQYALLAYSLGLLVFGGPVVASAMVGWLIGRGLKPAPAAQLASDPR